jgi:methylmalonyl-CoA mutase N-terminal domain/subunit
LKELKRTRNTNLVQSSLDELKRTAEGKGNLVPPTIEAVKNHASLGEVVESLRSVFGFFERPIIF